MPPAPAEAIAPPGPVRRRAWRLAAGEWTRWLDSSIPVPGTGRRVGWDGVIGLIPGVGDIAGFALAMAVVSRGALLGVRGWTLARLVVVALADAAVGAIPFVGVVLDLVFKANERNLAAIDRYAVDPDAVEAQSRRIVVGLGVVVLALVSLLAAGAVALASLVLRLL